VTSLSEPRIVPRVVRDSPKLLIVVSSIPSSIVTGIAVNLVVSEMIVVSSVTRVLIRSVVSVVDIRVLCSVIRTTGIAGILVVLVVTVGGVTRCLSRTRNNKSTRSRGRRALYVVRALEGVCVALVVCSWGGILPNILGARNPVYIDLLTRIASVVSKTIVAWIVCLIVTLVVSLVGVTVVHGWCRAGGIAGVVASVISSCVRLPETVYIAIAWLLERAWLAIEVRGRKIVLLVRLIDGIIVQRIVDTC